MAEEIINQFSVSAENTIATMRAHPFAYLIYYIGGIFILSVSYWYGYIYAGAGLLVVIASELLRRADVFIILNEGVARNFSLFSARHIVTPYQNIHTVSVAQSPFARLFGVGDVVMTTIGLAEKTIQFSGVRDPYAVAKMIEDRLVAA